MAGNPIKPRIRRTASLLLLLAFLSSLATGVVCYITPTGRVAHWTGWTFWGLDKESWQAVHTTTSILMLLAGFVHLWLNWGAILFYLRRSVHSLNGRSVELLLALALVLVTWVGSIRAWQPFAQIATWNESIKVWWEEGSQRPPRPHAEEATLQTLAKDYGLTPPQLIEKLRKAGFEPSGPEQVVGRLAARHNLSSAELLRRALGRASTRGKAKTPGNTSPPPSGPAHRDRPAGAGSGGHGYGRIDLAELCRRQGLDLEKALKSLAERDIEATGATRVRVLAERLGVRPSKVADSLRGGR